TARRSPRTAAALTRTRGQPPLSRAHPSAQAPSRTSDTRPAQFAQSRDPSGRCSARHARSLERTLEPLPVPPPQDAFVRAALELERAQLHEPAGARVRAHAPCRPCPEPPETSQGLA